MVNEGRRGGPKDKGGEVSSGAYAALALAAAAWPLLLDGEAY